MKYDYIVREIDAAYPQENNDILSVNVKQEMNTLGKQGYEMVSAVPYNRGIGTVRIILIYKRLIPE